MTQSLHRHHAMIALVMTMAWINCPECTAQDDHSSGKESSSLRLVSPEIPDLFQWTDTANVYVLRSADKALLFNLGDGLVVDQLSEIGVRQLEWVLLTDHHRENCQGFADATINGARVASSESERELLKNPTAFRRWYPKLGDKYSVYGASYVRPPAFPVAITTTLQPGEFFRWQGYEIKCLDTPGTSPGGMSFVIQYGDLKIAVTGSIMHDGARMANWFDSEWDYGFAKGVDTLIESVERLQGENIDIALPSQGPVIHHADEQLAEYAAKLKYFRTRYVRGYPVFDKDIAKRDPISQPTPVEHINRVTEHLYKLSHQHQGRNFAIIVSDNGRGLVLDCGLFPKQTLEEIVVGMRQHLGLKQIDAFWISHMHGDHFLLGPTMKEQYGAQAWTLDRIVDRCEHPRRYDFAALVSAYGDGFNGMTIDKAFRNGETVQWEGYTIHLDWMPGQTEFGCCLWLDIDGKRIAFTGDNLFGSPSDESQNGHEAVVCRNSCIFEEGYILGSKYLLDLKPDIVMGSHSYVMPEPEAFLQRYHAWSKEIAQLYRELLPQEDYEYGFDPYWVSAYPYRVDLTQATSQDVTISVRNFRDRPQHHRIRLRLPSGVTATPSILEGDVPADGRHEHTVKLTRTEPFRTEPFPAEKPNTDSNSKINTNVTDDTDGGVRIVPFDITLDTERHGELFDFLIRLPE
ncbi:MBL fold metallo-hydrolase [Stieleria varia]|uniref:Metallo-beta-lactamase superfamily protein n=1 Tax=Stieleria varia TaxID=2528005 RepID=A0A5C5ZWB3_9BACT|nr:MBL fold metallo-hydrolase [Stieleria varia]TWT91559.1 Metallo-beta-lactamase superfamily protein [Stieleria varia]